jgi:hypothetical protein
MISWFSFCSFTRADLRSAIRHYVWQIQVANQTFPPVRATDWTPACVQTGHDTGPELLSVKGNATAALNSVALTQ